MALVRYSLLRLALLVVVVGALWWAGLHPAVAVVVGALVAWGMSYVLLGRARDEAARQLADRAERRRAGLPTSSLDARLRADDDAEDAEAAEAAGTGGSAEADAQSARPDPSNTP